MKPPTDTLNVDQIALAEIPIRGGKKASSDRLKKRIIAISFNPYAVIKTVKLIAEARSDGDVWPLPGKLRKGTLINKVI